MCVGENTSQAASVEFVRRGRTNYARSRLQPLCQKVTLFDSISRAAARAGKTRRRSPRLRSGCPRRATWGCARYSRSLQWYRLRARRPPCRDRARAFRPFQDADRRCSDCRPAARAPRFQSRARAAYPASVPPPGATSTAPERPCPCSRAPRGGTRGRSRPR